jgi:hypothetical protein
MPKQLKEPTDITFGRRLVARCLAKARKAAGNRLREDQIKVLADIAWRSDSATLLRKLIADCLADPPISINKDQCVAALKAIVAAVEEKEAGMGTKAWAASAALANTVIKRRVVRESNAHLKSVQKIPLLEAKEIAREAKTSPETVRKANAKMRSLPKPKARPISRKLKEQLARGKQLYGPI